MSTKGKLLEGWSAGLDMRLVNTGNVPTCVRWQGSSVIDLTWVSPGLLNRVGNWRVRNDLESLSDHRYISFSLASRVSPPRKKIHGPRWNWRKLDEDMLRESAAWSCLVGPAIEEINDPNPDLWVDRVLREVCDASAPRVFARKPRKYVHWSTDEVDTLRRITIRARRHFDRSKRRGNEDETHAAHLSYKRAKAELKKEIARAKDKSWSELLA